MRVAFLAAKRMIGKRGGSMEDMISRQALCEYALNQKDKIITPNDIMRFPSAQPDSKETSPTHKALDTVSRQAVIEAINKIFPADPMRDDYTQGITCGAALANIYVAQLPSAQPETHEERTETHACDLISRQAAIDAEDSK